MEPIKCPKCGEQVQSCDEPELAYCDECNKKWKWDALTQHRIEELEAEIERLKAKCLPQSFIPPIFDTVDSSMARCVLWFAEGMRRNLELNIHKGNRESWIYDSPVSLMNHLMEEVDELREAMSSKGGGVFPEAFDVANMAMMVADAWYESTGLTINPRKDGE